MIYFNLKTPAKKIQEKAVYFNLKIPNKNSRKNSNRKFQFEQFTLVISASQTSITEKRETKNKQYFI